MSAATLSKSRLFARLADGAAGETTVITPNLRLAQALSHEYDKLQLAKGSRVWNAPDILPFATFVERAYEDALYSDRTVPLPVVLTLQQEEALWEDVIARKEANVGLLALSQAAASARDAWKTAHQWRLLDKVKRARRNDDAEAFAGWAERYERHARRDGLTDSARLPDAVAALLGEPCIRKPAMVVRYGFDIATAQQAAFFQALETAGCAVAACAPERRPSRVQRVRCLDTREEIRQAARWARARLEAAGGSVRIGVVVPDPSSNRNALRRIFAHTLGQGRVPPFNISVGEPLPAYPLVNTALLVLELAGREIDFERASLLFRSPFLAAGEAEMVQRARLDAELRKRAEPVLTLDRLLALVGMQAERTPAPVLSSKLGRLAEHRKRRLFGAQSPADWGPAMSEALSIMGFPGERSLDSAEYQTLKKWHAVLAQFSSLERVAPRMGYAEALSHLRRLASDTVFQPESPDVPIQILGVLESAGCEFDHLWVMGLSVEAWPLACRPNPFLPIALQREAGIPQSSAELSFELDRRITEGWMGAADEVVVSHPSREADRELAPSPLIAGVPEGTVELPEYPVWRNRIYASSVIERFEDATAPPVSAGEMKGGTLLIRDQAACPFRAFARHRLGAEGLETPHAGLDALERGALVHQVLAAAWVELGTKHALDMSSDADLLKVLHAAAEAAVARKKRERPSTLAGRFAEIEKRRLARLALDWLSLERGRGDFSVFATEAKRTLEVGGLTLSGRLDRVDETPDGARIVIDYKTGSPKGGVNAWLGTRPDEPQLPLYLTATEPAAQAIAFAQVKAGDMKLVALAATKDIVPGARVLPDARLKRAAGSWEAQVGVWRQDLDRIARGFGSGQATVDPKPGACDYCDLKPACRIHERDADAIEEDEPHE